MLEMQQQLMRQQQQQQQHKDHSTARVDLTSSSQVVASAVSALDGGPRYGLVLPTVVSGN